MLNQELWQAILAQLQFTISPANFATWLKSTYIISKKDGQLVISVPNNFSKEWLENKYNKLIFKALKSLDPEIRELIYAIEKSSVKPMEDRERPRHLPLQGSAQLELQELRIDKITNLNPRYTFDNFVVGPFNELAHAASAATAQNPGIIYNPLFIYGGVGLGKTHLLQAIGNKIFQGFPQKRMKYIPSERFTSEVISAIRNHNIESLHGVYRELDVFIIDDIQFLGGKDKTQEELFHIFNALYERGRQIIFSSDRPPKAISAIAERLRSRFEGGMIADIGAPDFETRMAILKTKIQEKSLHVADDVCEYIVSYIQRNIRELEGALNRVVAFYCLNNRTPQLSEAKTLLRSIIQAPSKLATPKKILQVVAEFYDLKEKDMLAPSRKKEIVRPRQIAMYLLREELKSSYPFIGKKFGGKDHTTAIYACEKISKELLESEGLVGECALLRQRIYSV